MIRQLIRSRRKYILVDVDTQKDFLLAEGKVCTRNHRRVLANIRRMMAWARYKNVPIISTCKVNPNNNGLSAIKYCLDGSEGQKKISYTLVEDRINFSADGKGDFPRDILRTYRQIILHKRSVDPFEEPTIERLLSEVMSGEFIVIGSCVEGAVIAVTLGLLHRGKKVTVVVDAVGSHNKREAVMAIRKLKAKGARLIETKKIAGNSHLKHVGACKCKACKGNRHANSVAVSIGY